MNTRSVLLACFASGMLLQALYLIHRNPRWGRLAFCIVCPAVYLGFMIIDAGHRLELSLGISFCMFAFLLALAYQDDILPYIGETALLSYTVIFWYGFASSFYEGTRAHIVLAALCALPSSAAVYTAFVHERNGFWWKLLLYVWFLAIVVTLQVQFFPFWNLSIFDEKTDVSWHGPFECFLAGMAALYLIVNATWLYLLIPIPGRSQSFRDRIREWQKLTGLMANRVADEQAAYGEAIVTVTIVGGLLLLNYVFVWLPHSMAISIAILTTAFLMTSQPSRPPRKALEWSDRLSRFRR